MAEDAPGNPGAATSWPGPGPAEAAVRRMQVKLHRWAGEDSSRRFGDLFNLVYDPAFLVHAWDRVASVTPQVMVAGWEHARGAASLAVCQFGIA